MCHCKCITAQVQSAWNARVLAGLGDFPVESNEMAMKRTGN